MLDLGLLHWNYFDSVREFGIPMEEINFQWNNCDSNEAISEKIFLEIKYL